MYGLVDENGGVFYVGSTVNLEARLHAHIGKSRLKIHSNKRVEAKVLQLLDVMGHLDWTALSHPAKEDLLKFEVLWTKRLIKSVGENILNNSIGTKTRYRRVVPHHVRIKLRANSSRKPVLCTSNGQVFESAAAAARGMGLRSDHVAEVAQGKSKIRKTVGGFKFKYVETH